MGAYKPMFTVALIGGIASGKSSALAFFQEKNITCISADTIAKRLTEKNTPDYQAIAQYLGSDYLDAHGGLDRSKMRKHLLHSPAFKQWLEQLLHPKIRRQMLELRNQATSPYCVFEIPLLKDKKSYGIDEVLCINCDEKKQIQRLQQRHLTEEEIQGLLAAQIPLQQRIELADVVINNDGSIQNFYQALEPLHEKYLKLSSEAQKTS